MMVESFILPGDQLKCVVPWELKSTVTNWLLPHPFLKEIHGGDRSFKNRVRRCGNESMEDDALWTGRHWFSTYRFLFVYFFAWCLLLNQPVNARWFSWVRTIHFILVEYFAQKGLALWLSAAVASIVKVNIAKSKMYFLVHPFCRKV